MTTPGRYLNITTGNQWRQDLRKWFSSPDPSTTHIILCASQHEGTAEWFFRGSLFDEWKSTGSLLWIHGKRMSSNPSLFHYNETCLCSGCREECSLVRRFSCVFFSRSLNYRLALQSFKISRLCAMMDWPLSHIFTSTSRIPINKIAETYCFLFFLSSLPAPIFAVICSTAYTSVTTTANISPLMTC